MSRLSKLFGKPIDLQIGGEMLSISPLNLEDLDLILDLESDNTKTKALKSIIDKTLKNAVPDSTPEERNKIAIVYFKELVEAIKKVNGLEDKQPSSPT